MPPIMEGIEYSTDNLNHSTLNDFPEELLIQTFALLPLEDRKNVKLVSKRWFTCCRCFSITKYETFVFRGDSSIPCILEILMPTTREEDDDRRIRIEFQDVSVHRLPSTLWEVCGHRIYTLELYQCRLDRRTFADIISYCVNLEALEIDLSRTRDDHTSEFIESLSTSLDSCEDVKHTKLRTLSLSFSHEAQQDLLAYIALFLTYPCVKNFNVSTLNRHKLPAIVAQFKHNAWFENMNAKIHTVLNFWCKQLESLTFNLLTSGEWMRKYSQRAHRLKKLETVLLYDECVIEDVLNFFAGQSNLTVVKLTFVEYDDDDLIQMFMSRILQSCPRLQELHVEFGDANSVLSFDWEEFSEFLALISGLQQLTLNFVLLAEPSAAEFKQIQSISSTGYALTALNLRNIQESVCDTFLKYCTKLEHLKLGTECTDYILQIIFEHLSNLRTLILSDVELCTDNGMIGQVGGRGKKDGLSIKQLQKLKHLGLYDLGYQGTSITGKLVFELQFPHLKFLGLGFGLYDKLSRELLVRLASNLPALEVLAIDEITDKPIRVSWKTFEFCMHLKKLTRLIFCHMFESSKYLRKLYHEDENGIRMLFQAYPNLKYISDWEQTTLIRNPHTNKVYVSDVKFQDSIFESIW